MLKEEEMKYLVTVIGKRDTLTKSDSVVRSLLEVLLPASVLVLSLFVNSFRLVLSYRSLDIRIVFTRIIL